MPTGVHQARSRGARTPFDPRGRTRRGRRITAALAAAIVALSSAACTNEPGPEAPPTSSVAAPPPNAPIRANARPGGSSLLPSDLTDETTRRLASLIYRGLVAYDAKGKATPALATSLTSTDGLVWTIRLSPGAEFADSSPITATTFARSWAFTAARTAASGASTPLARIDGYPGDGRSISGVEAVDETTLRVTLSHAAPGFGNELGDPTTVPLPPRAIADPATAAVHPVGNGPYVLDTEWTGGGVYTLRPNGVYSGADKPVNAGLTFHTYTALGQAYDDLVSGNLDLIDELPPDKAAEVARVGFTVGRQPVGMAVSLDFPAAAADWAGIAGTHRRYALATAIDRARAAQQDYAGARTPATDLAAPVVDGYSPDLCGDVCAADPEAAAEAWQAAGPLASLTIAYASDGADVVAVNAICADVTRVLGAACSGTPYPDETSLRTAVRAGEVNGPYLRTWRMRQRSLSGFLVPRFSPGALENWGGYVDPLAQTQLAVAVGAPPATSSAAFGAAQRLILTTLPAIPLWSVNATTTSAKTVTNVLTDAEGVPVYGQIKRPAG